MKHPYHLVNPSPWPIFISLAALTTTFGSVMYFHGHLGGGSMLAFGVVSITYAFGVWWRDVIREASFEGKHTSAVQQGLRYGVLLFILSEVLFFFAFFWAFFHSSLSPAIEIGGIWPPRGITVINPWEVPFVNTIILLTSGASITWSHHALLYGNRTQALIGLGVSIALACVFTAFQAMEYIEAPFTLSDSVYGSIFYMTTGFHGLHVIIGTIFLMVSYVRIYVYHLHKSHHFGFEAAAWYWHFVDVVWLLLFVAIYWWGGL